MRELFPGFNHNPDFEKLWNECFFVLDTNVLLRLYEYSESTTDNILDFLEHEEIRDKLWLPHQIALEFQKNRLKVIWEQENLYKEIINFVKEYSNDIINLKKKFKKRKQLFQSDHRHLNLTEIFDSVDQEIETLLDSLEEIKKSIEKKKHTDSKLSDEDVIEVRLNKLFGKHNISKPYNKDKINEIIVESEFRYKNEIPPAFRDEKDGDLILWFQIIDFARKNNVPIIFVTDDTKEDWWFKNNKGDLIGPHPFLVQEFTCETKQMFHMYRPKKFLEYLQQYIHDLEMDPKTIEDVASFKPPLLPSVNDLIISNEALKNINRGMMIPNIKMAKAMSEINRNIFKASLAMNSLQNNLINLSSINSGYMGMNQLKPHTVDKNEDDD